MLKHPLGQKVESSNTTVRFKQHWKVYLFLVESQKCKCLLEVFLFVVLSHHYKFFDYLRIFSFWIFESTFAVVSMCKVSWGWFKHSQIYQALKIKTKFSQSHTVLFSHFWQTSDLYLSLMDHDISLDFSWFS